MKMKPIHIQKKREMHRRMQYNDFDYILRSVYLVVSSNLAVGNNF